MKTAVLFSGQGSQYPQMGKKWADLLPSCREIFTKAGADITNMCFFGSAAELKKTENTQPCLYTADLVYGAAAREALDRLNIKVSACAGFSLGEYAALCYAGVFSFEEGLKLARKRGMLMDKAGEGGMAAIIGAREKLYEAIDEVKGSLWPVNYNCPGQTVVAGDNESLSRLYKKCPEYRLKMIPLEVSGPFHSPVMESVSNELLEIFNDMVFAEPEIPVYSNLTAKPYKTPKNTLALQCKSPVLWEDTLKNMYDDGIRLFIEAGPGKTLTGLVKKTLPGAAALAVDQTADFEALCGTIDAYVG